MKASVFSSPADPNERVVQKPLGSLERCLVAIALDFKLRIQQSESYDRDAAVRNEQRAGLSIWHQPLDASRWVNEQHRIRYLSPDKRSELKAKVADWERRLEQIRHFEEIERESLAAAIEAEILACQKVHP